jgi:hypothetical protein
MPTRKELDAEKDYYSSRISETSRFVGFGLLASYYALTVSPTGAFQANEHLLTGVGFLGAWAVFFDYLQYVTGYLMTRATHRKGGDSGPYSYGDGAAAVYFGLKTISFVAKQLAAGLGSVALIALIWSAQN